MSVFEETVGKHAGKILLGLVLGLPAGFVGVMHFAKEAAVDAARTSAKESLSNIEKLTEMAVKAAASAEASKKNAESTAKRVGQIKDDVERKKTSIEEQAKAVEELLKGKDTGALVAALQDLSSRGLDVSVPASAISEVSKQYGHFINEVTDLKGRIPPKGTIILWSGPVAKIPKGWVLCNGSNGTPDLRDKFVMGAGGGAKPRASGGPSTHTHASDPRPGTYRTDTHPGHNHAMPASWYFRYLGGGGFNAVDIGATDKIAPTQHGGAHSHAVAVDPPPHTTGPSAGDNRPAWYALSYIMKT